MKKDIVVLDADQQQCRQLCNLLEKERYSTIPVHSIQYLEAKLNQGDCLAVVLDIDTVPIDNRTIRDLTKLFPKVFFFCLSEQPFHPELKDAICHHIYACLNKPIDPHELLFWIKCVNEEKKISTSEIGNHQRSL